MKKKENICPLCSQKTKEYQMGHYCTVVKMKSESPELEEIVDKVKIEGMLHILPDDRDKMISAIQKWIDGKMPYTSKHLALTAREKFIYLSAIKDTRQALGLEDK